MRGYCRVVQKGEAASGYRKPTRRERDVRRGDLVESARALFFDEPFAGIGMPEIAAAGQVSRATAYRYFPGGRAEVFLAVAESVVEELRDRLHHATEGPFSAAKRMEHLLAALFSYFSANPAAYRLLFQDLWATGDADVARAVVAARAPLAAEVASIVAAGGGEAADVVLTSNGILGCGVANLEQVFAGTVDGESAWRVTCEMAVACLR